EQMEESRITCTRFINADIAKDRHQPLFTFRYRYCFTLPSSRSMFRARAPARQGTLSFSINPAGTITGRYSDASDVLHGFLRTPDGTITTFDAPNAGTDPCQGTIVLPSITSTLPGRSRQLP